MENKVHHIRMPQHQFHKRMQPVYKKPIAPSKLPIEIEHTYRNNGTMRYAKIKIRIEEEIAEELTGTSNPEFTYSWMVKDHQIPSEFKADIYKALQNFCLVYSLTRSETIVLRFSIIDGNFHPVESCGIGFTICIFRALEKAFISLHE